MNYIPKLEWNFISVVGNTSTGSPIITNISSTTSVIAGMVVSSSAFAAGTTVLSKTSNTITLSANASGNNTALTNTLFEQIVFEYPCEKKPNEKYDVNNTVSASISGIRQVQLNHIAATFDLTFKFITRAVFTKFFERFYLAHAALGNTFRFYESKDETSFLVYELDTYDFTPEREVAKAGDFLFKYKVKFRRLVL
jgi:hypothetical protein